MKPTPRWLRWLVSALALSIAAWLLWHSLRGLSLVQVDAALASIPPWALLVCLGATALSFLCLAAYERMATQWLAPGQVPRVVAWRTGLVAHALANTLGFHAITAVALRLERYRAHGVDAAQLAKIVAAIGGCVASGVVAVVLGAGAWWMWGNGFRAPALALAIMGSGAYFVLRKRTGEIASGTQAFPRLGVVFALGFVEVAAAMAALAVLVPEGVLPGGPAFVLLFASAMVLGVASHAPGGLGVFEATVLAAAAPGSQAQVLAALLAYRVLYNLVPFALALLALVAEAIGGRVSSTAGTRP